jgi:hypothetical protein
MRWFTRFRLSRRIAYRLLLAIGLPAVFAVTLSLMMSHAASQNKNQTGEGDLALFRAVVNGERAGRPYYEAYGAESRTRGYPTRSVFNWRQPLLLRGVALLSPKVSLVIFMGLALVLLAGAHALLGRELLGILMMLNAASVTVTPGSVYFTESWAGLCLGLSAIAYARRRETAGAGWAILALFIRELAAPYCVVAGLIALSRKRWREVGVWIGGGILYAAYFGAHVWQVWHHIVPGDQSHPVSWLYFGGLPFVLKVWQVHGVLTAAPLPFFSLLVVAGVAAWWAPQMPLHVRVNVLVYSVLFLFVGLPFNAYWGEMIAPLVALWLTFAPTGLSTLWTHAELPRAIPSLNSLGALVPKPSVNNR